MRPSVRKGREKYARLTDCLEGFLSEGFAFGEDQIIVETLLLRNALLELSCNGRRFIFIFLW